MWNKCDIIELFHTEELVKHLFPTSVEIAFDFHLLCGLMHSWCAWHRLLKGMRNVVRKLEGPQA